VEDLANRVAVLQRLPAAEFDVLVERLEGKTVEEIGTALDLPERDTLFRLGHVYDSLWLTHLPRERRIAELEEYGRAIEHMRDNEQSLPGTAGTPGTEPTPGPPSHAAVSAVIDDERDMVARRPIAPIVAAGGGAGDGVTAAPSAAAGSRDPARRTRILVLSLALIGVIALFAFLLAVVNNDEDDTDDPGIGGATTPTATSAPQPQQTPTPPATEPVPAVTPAETPPTPADATATPQPATPTPQPVAPTPTTLPLPATATPIPEPQVAFSADMTTGIDEWQQPEGTWQVMGDTIETTDPGPATIFAPHQPAAGNEYVIEAQMQAIDAAGIGSVIGFAIDTGEGERRVAAAPITDTEWHTYRLEVRGEQIAFIVDGNLVSEVATSEFVSPDAVGIFSAGTRVRVRSLEIWE
jgi:outer membrane biosynthesis protein TonB